MPSLLQLWELGGHPSIEEGACCKENRNHNHFVKNVLNEFIKIILRILHAHWFDSPKC